jgi:hypothetical protein
LGRLIGSVSIALFFRRRYALWTIRSRIASAIVCSGAFAMAIFHQYHQDRSAETFSVFKLTVSPSTSLTYLIGGWKQLPVGFTFTEII